MLPTESHEWIPALLAGLSAFADAILGVGTVVPGEIAVTGLATTIDDTQTVSFVAAVTVGASLGDHLNYGLGRAFGGRLAASRVVAVLGVRHWHRAVKLLDRFGPRALVLTRLIPVVRTLLPAIAGATGLPYRRFLPASLMGSLLWALSWVLAGNVVTVLLRDAGPLAALSVVGVAGLLYLSRGSIRGRRPRAKPDRQAVKESPK